MKIDPNVLQQLAKSYGVAPVNMIQGVSQFIQHSDQADNYGHEILTSNGFTFNPADRAYHNESQFEEEDQKIYAIAETPKGPLYLWIWADQLARIIPGPEKLTKWLVGDGKYIGGKVKHFIKTYLDMTGQQQSQSIPITHLPSNKPEDRMAGPEPEPEEPVGGPVPDRSGVGEPAKEADAIIARIMRKAKISPGTKLSKQPPIRLSHDDIIDLYRTAEKMEDQEQKEKLMRFIKVLSRTPKDETIKKSQLEELIREIVRGIVKEGWQDNYVPGRDPYGMKPTKVDPNEKWVETFANKLWPDPLDIGHERSRDVKWRVIKSKKAGTGEMVYQLGKTKTIHLSKFIIKRGKNWYYLDEDPKSHTKKWVKMTEKPPKGESPVNPKDPEIDEMTGTAAVSPIMTPNAFGKKKKSEEESVNEMTTTGTGTPGYQIPGWVSRKGGSKAGVAGSAALGYTLTPIGQKDMERQGDKLI